MSENTRNVSAQALQSFVEELFAAGGMRADEAAWYAQTIVQSNLWGIDSHGVIRVPTYFERIRKDAINRSARMRIERRAPAVTLLDADGGAGAVAGKRAMEQAVSDARSHGVGICGVTNSNHFGAAALYSRLAVREGMIGVSMTNVRPLIAAPGARAAVVGNNPFSIAIPTYCDFPFVLDMSLSVVAGGKLHLAAAKGEKIPYGWGVDRDGRPTDDPKAAIDGFLLPIGGYKGLGLGYAVDILCGVLTGGLFAEQMRSMYHDPDVPSLTGHLMMAVDLSAWITPEEMKRRMEHYRDFIRSVPMAEGAPPLVFPGEPEEATEAKRRREGIPVPLSTLEELERLKAEYGVRAELIGKDG
ncbi:MAG: Ldh family oxidoreductase [Oscillospiraceae bacterium]|nr:Ldh family oxidoreductase [Oscillospiraceae bacterium]